MPLKHTGDSPQKRFLAIKKALQNLPVQIANTAFNHFDRNFATQSWEGKKWKPRSPWAVRNEGRAILHDTGDLRRALTKQVTGSRIRIFIAPPYDKYGNIHNTGGTITIPANKKSERFFWAMYAHAPSGVEKSRWKAMALKMRSGKSITLKIPKRKFIGESEKLNQKIADKIDVVYQKFNS
jgi:phage gpG-like protein